MSVPVTPSAEFSDWLAGQLSSRNSGLDAPSLVEYVSGVLAADAGSGESQSTQQESVKDIIEGFEVCGPDDAETLAEEIVATFNRLCVSSCESGAGAGAGGSALSSVEAEALKAARQITVQQRRPDSDKLLILQACANIDDGADEEDPTTGEEAPADADGKEPAPAFDNRRAMENEEKLKRERMKLQHSTKVEKDKLDREKQKKAKEARKEAEKKRTQKQERRK